VAWILLVVAGLLEVVWAFAMKQSQGFTRILPATISLVGMIASIADGWATASDKRGSLLPATVQ